MRVLFVCTGNTCRSPMAAAIARHHGVEARSAGLAAFPGAPMAPAARRALLARGIDPEGHAAQLPRASEIAWADVVLVMEERHRPSILEAFPWAGGWTMTLARFGGEEGDVADPVGGSDATYEATLGRIEELFTAGLKTGFQPPVVAWAAGSDHAGFHLKMTLMGELDAPCLDVGTGSAEVSCDYPDFAYAVGHLVASGKAQHGLLVCGSGIGMAISANKVPGVRAATAWDVTSARLSREHNDANVICFGERLVGSEVAKDALRAFSQASFAAGRHTPRVAKIMAIEREAKDES